MYTACSFTGHRIIPQNIKKKLVELIDRSIDYTYKNGCRAYYCGGALGFDTLCALEVIKYRVLHPDVRLYLLLPCIDQDISWSVEQRERYNYILSSADHVEYTSTEYTNDCMRRRNERLAECADVVIAYVGRQNSGSAQTVRIAKRSSKEVFNLYPTAHSRE